MSYKIKYFFYFNLELLFHYTDIISMYVMGTVYLHSIFINVCKNIYLYNLIKCIKLHNTIYMNNVDPIYTTAKCVWGSWPRLFSM